MAQTKSVSGHSTSDWLAQASLAFMHAGLTLTVAAIPLFMVPHYTTEPFEFNKAALLRTLAPLLVPAWAILLMRTRRLDALGLPGPLAFAVAAYVLFSLLATLLSIAPRISLWGSHVRSFGTLTTLAGAFFFVASCSLHNGAAVFRLEGAILLASLPVSFYALLQVFGVDPLSQAIQAHTASSFLGNPNFVAAYMVMVIPLTCSALLSELWSTRSKLAGARVRAASLAGMLLLQGTALWFSRGRGAALGLLAGMTLFVLLLAILTQRRRIVFAMVGALSLGGIVLLSSASPLASWIQHTLSSGTGYQRLLIWQSVEQLVFASPARLLIGYGPETLYMALNPYYPPEEISTQVLGPGTIWDRAHNSLLDTAASTGLLGVAATLWVAGAFLLKGLSGLGMAPKPWEVWLALGGGALAGVLGLPLFLRSWGAAPLGLAIGLVLGLFLFLIGKCIRPLAASTIPLDVRSHQFLLVGLLAALVAHFVEVQFGFELVPTQLAFWVYGGMISAIVHGTEPSPREVAKRQPRASSEIGERRLPTRGSWVSAPHLFQALLVGLVLATIAFSLGLQALDLRKAWPGPALLLGSVWILGSLLATGWCLSFDAEGVPFRKGFPLILLGSLAWGSAFLPGHLWMLRAEPLPARLVVPFGVYLLITVGLMAGLTFVSGSSGGPSSRRPTLLWLAPLFLALGIWSGYRIGVVPIIAESYARAGFVAIEAKQANASIVLLQQAVALQPERDRYFMLLADAYLQKAKVSSPPEPWLRESESLFLKAARMTPTDPDHLYHLGTLHLRWAALVQPWGDWRDHLETSIKYYVKAVELGSPHRRKLVRERLTDLFTSLGLSPDQAAREAARRLPSPGNR